MEKYQNISILGGKGAEHSSENTETHVFRKHEICLMKMIPAQELMNCMVMSFSW